MAEWSFAAAHEQALAESRRLRTECAVEGCSKAIQCRGWCRVHYRRWLKWGDPTKVHPMYAARAEPKRCSVDGCRKVARAKGRCWTHGASQDAKPKVRHKIPVWLDLDRLARTVPTDGWWLFAACRGEDTDLFFPERGGASTREQKEICAGCPVVYACLAEQLANVSPTTDHGIWGRTTARQRRTIRRALVEHRRTAA